MQEKDFDRLIDRYLSGYATPLEKELVEAHLRLMEDMNEKELSKSELALHKAAVWARLRPAQLQSKDLSNGEPTGLIRMMKRVRWAAAAVILVAMGVTYFLVHETPAKLPVITYKGDVAPGREGSRLRLSDGRIIITDTIKDGLIAMEGKVKVIKKGGKIIYEGAADKIVYNEIFADKGHQSSAVVLPDGSVVWLNAASSLRYPLQYAGNERLVTMTGEIYFEVAHKEKQPFRVKAGNQIIEDIGTSFNVNTYADEPAAKITLMEGVVKVNNTLLKPGQQYDNGKVVNVNTDEVMAWKNGFISVRDADIRTVMRQLARWYDVQVSYEGEVKGQTFTGKIDRNLTLSQMLNVLSDSKVHYRIEDGKHIVIIP